MDLFALVVLVYVYMYMGGNCATLSLFVFYDIVVLNTPR